MTAASTYARPFNRGGEVHLGDPLKLPFARELQKVQRLRVSQAYRILVTTAACALSWGQQEALYLRTIQGLDRSDLDVIVRSFHQLILDMEDRPYTDLLGPLYMEIGHTLDKQASGEFFTPRSVSGLLARMTAGPDVRRDFPADGPLLLNEPACGTGGMVLAFAEALAEQGISSLHTRWTVQDLSETSCYAAYVNTTLWRVPALVVCGNTLSAEVRWAWRNVWHAQACALPSPEDDVRFERLTGAMRQFLAPETPSPAQAALTPRTRPHTVTQPPLFTEEPA